MKIVVRTENSMPFFDNTGVDLEEQHGPIWAAFATLRDQLERLVVLNLLWSFQLIPAIVALAFPEVSMWLRLPLLLYTGLIIAPITAVLYGLIMAAVQGEPLTREAVFDEWRRLARPGVHVLGPLFATLGLVCWLVSVVASLGTTVLVIDVALRLLLLLGLVVAQYWGPLVADLPDRSVATILRQSIYLAWRYPRHTLQLAAAVVVALLLGAISVGGLFLVVPVVVALLQTHMYMALQQRRLRSHLTQLAQEKE